MKDLHKNSQRKTCSVTISAASMLVGVFCQEVRCTNRVSKLLRSTKVYNHHFKNEEKLFFSDPLSDLPSSHLCTFPQWLKKNSNHCCTISKLAELKVILMVVERQLLINIILSITLTVTKHHTAQQKQII